MMKILNNSASNRKRILLKVLIRFGLAIVLLFTLLFIPAGTIKFSNGWLYMAGILIPMLFALAILLYKDPELLEKRVNLKEKEDPQKKYVKVSILLFVITFIIPGLDFRFHWSHVPLWLVVVSLFVMIAGYVMFIMVMLQNSYASRVIEIQNEQKLIDTGLYSLVRHPMYLSASILYLASPLVLGSFYALIPISALPFLLGYRILNEEKVLIKGLPGYENYIKKVRFRLLPFIW